MNIQGKRWLIILFVGLIFDTIDTGNQVAGQTSTPCTSDDDCDASSMCVRGLPGQGNKGMCMLGPNADCSGAKAMSCWPEGACDTVDNTCKNDQFFKLKSIFLASGKGCRPDFPQVTLDNTLLLQVMLLKEQGNKSFHEAAQFLQQLFPSAEISRLRYLFQNSDTNLKATHPSHITAFLSQTLEITLSVGPFLEKTGLSRSQLLSGNLVSSFVLQSVGLLKDLNCLRKKEDKSFQDMCKWWHQVTGHTVDCKTLKNATETCMKKNSKLQAGSVKPKRAEAYKQFLLSSPFTDLSSASSAPTPLRPSAEKDSESLMASVLSDQTNFHLTDDSCTHLRHQHLVSKLAETSRQLVAARRKIQEDGRRLEDIKLKLAALMEEKRATVIQMNQAKEAEINLSTKNKTLTERLQECSAQNQSDAVTIAILRKHLKYYQKQGHQRKISHLQKKLQEEKMEHKKAACLAQKKQQESKKTLRKLRLLQLGHNNMKHRLQLKKTRHVQSALQHQHEPAREQIYVVEDPRVIRLKDERGFFKKEAIVCVMTLAGECEVAPNRCGAVLDAVVKHLLNATIPPGDLPSERSALRFVDQGHVLSKMQIAETVLEGKNWDLHTDGTTRSGHKFVSQQVNVDGQFLYTGFSTLPSENAITLVDETFNMLPELSEIFEKDEAQQHFLFMLKSLSGGMTDRAEIMKAFMKRLQEDRKEILNLEDHEADLQMLHCNAHFLLGLSTETEKLLCKDEEDGGVKLGRDKLTQFNRFQSSESSTARYIRLACDLFRT